MSINMNKTVSWRREGIRHSVHHRGDAAPGRDEENPMIGRFSPPFLATPAGIALLCSRGGKPAAEETIGSEKWLTYVVNNGAVPGPTMSLSIGGFGFGGGRVAMGGGVGVTTPIGAPTPLTCTTRFLVENGKVSTWTFDGAGCGAAN